MCLKNMDERRVLGREIGESPSNQPDRTRGTFCALNSLNDFVSTDSKRLHPPLVFGESILIHTIITELCIA